MHWMEDKQLSLLKYFTMYDHNFVSCNFVISDDVQQYAQQYEAFCGINRFAHANLFDVI